MGTRRARPSVGDAGIGSRVARQTVEIRAVEAGEGFQFIQFADRVEGFGGITPAQRGRCSNRRNRKRFSAERGCRGAIGYEKNLDRRWRWF